MTRLAVGMIVALTLAGCASNNAIPYNESGDYVWCNKRYLFKNPKQPIVDKTHADVARDGYIYAVAAALALQKDDEEGRKHWFEQPKRLKLVNEPPREKYGFEVKAFELYIDENQSRLKEIVVAFVGSNDAADWFWTNLLFDQSQYEHARNYVKRIKSQYPNTPLVVTGISLGGGLAVHVTKDDDTKKMVKAAWAFNPSPKTYADGKTDDRIWVGAVDGEILSSLRSAWWRWWPGVNNIGAPADQKAEGYNLIEANSAYSHFRWVLPRNLLHIADWAIDPNGSTATTEPLEILRHSSFAACKRE
ncbi:MAG: hypothetical protein H8K08_06655 [Nitrospira sp.]|nr:hypothetical protein [Nitrospira sp.]